MAESSPARVLSPKSISEGPARPGVPAATQQDLPELGFL